MKGADSIGRDKIDQVASTEGAGINDSTLATMALSREVSRERNREQIENKSAGRLEQARDKLALSHQVLISPDSDGRHLTYSVRSGDRDIDVFKSENSQAGLQKADRELTKLVKAKTAQMESSYKLTFSRDNEDVTGQIATASDGTLLHGKMIHARAPNLSELYSIEHIIDRAMPSQLASAKPSDGDKTAQGVKFYFLKESLYQDDHGAVATYRHSDKDGKPAVYIGPDGIGTSLQRTGDRISWQGGVDEHMLLHELSHNSQFRLGLEEEQKLLAFSKRCGFEPFVKPGSNETVWALKGKDGKLYQREADGWQQIDDKGNVQTNVQSNVRSADGKSHLIDDIEMAKLASVTPPTFYFDNPTEMAAEGMAMLREGEASRKELLSKTPVFYQFMKEQDQEDINLAYGLTASGEAKMLRRPDGRLTGNDASTRQMMSVFESLK